MTDRSIEEVRRQFLQSRGLTMDQSALVGSDGMEDLLGAVSQENVSGRVRHAAAFWREAESSHLGVLGESQRLEDMVERATQSTSKSPVRFLDVQEGGEATVRPKKEERFYAPLGSGGSAAAETEQPYPGSVADREWLLRERERMFQEKERMMNKMFQLMERQEMQWRVQTPEAVLPNVEYKIQKQTFPVFEKDMDVQVYLNLFEQSCQDKNLPESEFCKVLRVVAPVGFLGELLNQLPVEQRNSYQTLKDLIQDRSGLSAEGARQKFRKEKRGTQESFVGHAIKLERHFQTWEEVGGLGTKQQLAEAVKIEQLFRSVPEAMFPFTSECRKLSLFETAKRLDKVVSEVFRGVTPLDRQKDKDFATKTRWPAGGVGSVEKAKEETTFSKEVPRAESTPRPRWEEKGPVQCFYCKNYGHTRNRCEKRKQDEAAKLREGGSPWGQKASTAAVVKKIEGAPPPVSESPWIHELKEVALAVVPQEAENWEEPEEEEVPTYAKINMISEGKKKQLSELGSAAVCELPIATLVSPEQRKWMEQCRAVQVEMGDLEVPLFGKIDCGADLSSVHVEKMALGRPCGVAVVKAYGVLPQRKPVIECKIKLGDFEGYHKFLVHQDPDMECLVGMDLLYKIAVKNGVEKNPTALLDHLLKEKSKVPEKEEVSLLIEKEKFVQENLRPEVQDAGGRIEFKEAMKCSELIPRSSKAVVNQGLAKEKKEVPMHPTSLKDPKRSGGSHTEEDVLNHVEVESVFPLKDSLVLKIMEKPSEGVKNALSLEKSTPFVKKKIKQTKKMLPQMAGWGGGKIAQAFSLLFDPDGEGL